MTDRIPLDELTSDALDQLYAERDQYAAAIRELIVQVKKTAYLWSQQFPDTMPTSEVVAALGLLAPRPLPAGLRDDMWQRIAAAYYLRFENDGHPEDSTAAADEAMAIVQPVLRRAEAAIERVRAELEEARMWARHGYEIGQRSCTWSDHGVAPAWLTEPTALDPQEPQHGAHQGELTMKKIPTLFVRDAEDRQYVTREVNPGCEWVIAGEGVATVKWDGTCVSLDWSGVWWARREVKPGKPYPDVFVEEQHDPVTGKSVGWEPIEQSPFRKFHAEAVAAELRALEAGTYELVGPKVQGNPSGFDGHLLIRHGWAPLTLRVDAEKAPRDYDGLRAWLHARDHEGLVFHHEDGRMVKIKAKDFRR